MVVVSNRLPFVLVRKEDGSLERRMRYLRFNWWGSELYFPVPVDLSLLLLQLLLRARAPGWVITYINESQIRLPPNRLDGQAYMISLPQRRRFPSAHLEVSPDRRMDLSRTASFLSPSSRDLFSRITTTVAAMLLFGLCFTACRTGRCSTEKPGSLTRPSTKSLA